MNRIKYLAISIILLCGSFAYARVTGTPPSTDDVFCVGIENKETCLEGANGDYIPTATGNQSLGTTSFQWRNLWVSSNAYITGTLVSSGTYTPTGGLVGPVTVVSGSMSVVGGTFSAGVSTFVIISGGVGISTNSPGQFIGGAWDSRSNKPQVDIAGVNPRLNVNGSGDAGLFLADAGNSVDERIAGIGLSGTLLTIQSKTDAGAASKNYVTMNQNTGNVGINLIDGNSPASAFDVYGAFQWGNSIAVSSGSADGRLTVANVLRVSSGAAAGPAYAFSAGTGTGVYYPAASSLGLVTQGAERARIDASGKLGLGTTDPGSLLSVHGAGQWGTTQISTLTANGSVTLGGGAIIQSSGTGAPILTASDGIEQTRNANLVLAHQTNRNRGTCLIGGMWSDSSIQGNQAETCVTGDQNVDPGSVQFFTGNISTGRVVFSLGTGAARPEKVWMNAQGIVLGTTTRITAGDFTVGNSTIATNVGGVVDLSGNLPNLGAKGANPRLHADGTSDSGIYLADSGGSANEKIVELNFNSPTLNVRALDNAGAETKILFAGNVNSGNTGIGTTSPASLFHVNGSAQFGTTAPSISSTTAAGFFVPAVLTEAQFNTTAPGTLGAIAICSNCTNSEYTVCVGSGTAAAQWRDVRAATTVGCGTDN